MSNNQRLPWISPFSLVQSLSNHHKIPWILWNHDKNPMKSLWNHYEITIKPIKTHEFPGIHVPSGALYEIRSGSSSRLGSWRQTSKAEGHDTCPVAQELRAALKLTLEGWDLKLGPWAGKKQPHFSIYFYSFIYIYIYYVNKCIHIYIYMFTYIYMCIIISILYDMWYIYIYNYIYTVYGFIYSYFQFDAKDIFHDIYISKYQWMLMHVHYCTLYEADFQHGHVRTMIDD